MVRARTAKIFVNVAIQFWQNFEVHLPLPSSISGIDPERLHGGRRQARSHAAEVRRRPKLVLQVAMNPTQMSGCVDCVGTAIGGVVRDPAKMDQMEPSVGAPTELSVTASPKYVGAPGFTA